ncbi:MAG: VWA domain-containing protein [Lentisphaeria bacterium]|nr:VWA domain-containing protein [Lentisphaeria bacterium]
MKKDYTHIGIVLDASGSMACIENDIKGSFNSFLNKQREAEGKTVFDLFQFSDNVEHLVKSADLSLFKDDLMAKYTCSGCTALNDAVCIAIDTMGKEFAAMPEDERPENVLCVIITDGEENASEKYRTEDVKKRIEHQQSVYSWEFLFLAANQDAFQSGSSIGIAADSCLDFLQTPAGVDRMSISMCDRATAVRSRRGKTNK